MNKRDLISWFRAELLATESTGLESLPVADLLQRLAKMEELAEASGDALDTVLVERFKAASDLYLSHFRAQADQHVEILRATVSGAQSATAVSLAMNGGAALALLALMGHLASEPAQAARMSSLVLPLGSFALGVLANALTSGFAYLANYRFYKRDLAGGRKWRLVAISLHVAGLVLFALGCATAARVFLSQ